MKPDISKVFRSPLTIAIVGGPIATVIGGWLLGLFTPEQFRSFFNWLLERFQLELLRVRFVPSWILLLLIALSLPTVLNAMGKLRNREYSHLIDGIQWRWRLAKSEVTGLKCYCPDDDTLLLSTEKNPSDESCIFPNDDWRVTYKCDSCGKTFGPFWGRNSTHKEAVKRQIERANRTKTWDEIACTGQMLSESKIESV